MELFLGLWCRLPLTNLPIFVRTAARTVVRTVRTLDIIYGRFNGKK